MDVIQQEVCLEDHIIHTRPVSPTLKDGLRVPFPQLICTLCLISSETSLGKDRDSIHTVIHVEVYGGCGRI